MLSLYHYQLRGWRRLGYELGKLVLVGVILAGGAVFVMALGWMAAR